MKRLGLVLLALPFALSADEAADRAAVDKLITALQASKAQAGARTGLLSSDIDRGEFDREFAALDAGMVDATGVWREVTRPALVVSQIRFVTPDVALVDGASVQAGSVMMRRVPFVLIARREQGGWKIAVLRSLAPTPPPFVITRLVR